MKTIMSIVNNANQNIVTREVFISELQKRGGNTSA
jgi:hypothetical protein